ncbi:glucose 1-dehydrogenase [Xylariaceae sp. FL0016]|nr:glucose 1-dehydrogenase [Xylariaceae sp. FL0016]
MAKRALVCYCVDVDACSLWINTGDGSSANASNLSRGIFGANVGLERLLGFFDRHAVKATLFTPSHSILSFPEQLAKQRKVMAKSIQVYKEFTGGKHPRGWTAPYWDVAPTNMQILEDFGIDYDHSLIHHDCLPYWAADVGDESVAYTRYGQDPDLWMRPMKRHRVSKVVEVPASWDVDDWPHLNIFGSGGGGYVNPRDLQQMWEDQFEYLYKEHDTFVYCISIHPQVSGKSKVLPMHKRFMEFLKKHEGVEFVPAEFVCDEFKAGRIPEAKLAMGI